MTLNDVEKGKEYIVEKSMLQQPVKRRLEAMGLIEGTMLRKINEAFDGSLIFMVRGSRLAIGKELAEAIIVRDITIDDMRHRRRGRGLGPRNGSGRGKGRGRGRKRGDGIACE